MLWLLILVILLFALAGGVFVNNWLFLLLVLIIVAFAYDRRG